MEGKRKYDVTALGELLIDFTQYGVSEQGNRTFEANPGGAPCNMLSMLARLGRKTAFIGKVGDDAFGRLLAAAAEEQGIDTGGLVRDSSVHTTLTFVHRLPDGDRDFTFYRSPGADMKLESSEIDTDKIKDSRIFHFGSLSLTDEPARSATERAILTAQESGCLISFDPNLRPPLWGSMSDARTQIARGISVCDILKISDDEIRWFTGKDDLKASARDILGSYKGIRLLCVTKGPYGSTAYYEGGSFDEPAFLSSDTVETTGAGDTFDACMLDFVLEHGLESLSGGDIHSMLTFANAAASIITTRKGALRVMPSREEVVGLIAGAGRN
jgi:fructokinase